MRDIFLLAIIAAALLATLRKPQIGLLTWLWISVMNPHRLSYGFSYTAPLLDLIAITTIASCLFHWKEKSSAEFHSILKLLMIFYIWTTLTTLFSVDFNLSFPDWLNFTKSLLLVVLLLLFMNKKHWILACIAVFIVSIAFTGFKGGVFTLLTGGSHKIWGPPGSAWGDNNGVSVAMLMLIPITIAFRHNFRKNIHRLATLGFASTFFMTLLGTQSRGGLVGFLAMGALTAIRSQKKLLSIFMMIFMLIAGYFFMPQSWHDRMATIETYETDKSATTRLIQWQYAIDISLERPFFGNGFDAFYYKPYYHQYVEQFDKNRAVHSNYFQVLGEQGYIGLLFYLSIIFVSITQAKKYAQLCNNYEELIWASSLLNALQFSIIGYAFNGLTVNMAYLDLYYYLLAFVVLLISYIKMHISLDKAKPINKKNNRLIHKI